MSRSCPGRRQDDGQTAATRLRAALGDSGFDAIATYRPRGLMKAGADTYEAIVLRRMRLRK